MKKATVSFEYDDERLKAIKRFATKKNISYKEELKGCMDKMYKKYVPATVREYLEDCSPAKNNSKGNEE